MSLPLDMYAKVERRIRQLRPRVSGFSHYVQVLIHEDLTGKRSPFSEADGQHVSLAA